MKGFIGNLISRHLETGKNILPRLPGRYEDADNFSNMSGNFAETNDRLPNLAPSGYPPYSENNPEKSKTIYSPDSQSKGFPANAQVSHSENNFGEEQSIRITNGIPGSKSQQDSPGTDLKRSKPGSYSHLTTVPDNPVSAEKTTSAERNPFLSGPSRINSKADESNAAPLQNDSSDQEPKLSRNAGKIMDHPDRISQETTQKVKPISEKINIKPADHNTGGAFGIPPGATNTKPNLSQSLSATFGSTETRQVIKVTIGQINVRAVMQSTPAAPQKPKSVRNPAFSLEDYLKQRTTE
jgi:hypothetical protein